MAAITLGQTQTLQNGTPKLDILAHFAEMAESQGSRPDSNLTICCNLHVLQSGTLTETFAGIVKLTFAFAPA